MSILHINQIKAQIQNLFEPFIDKSDIGNKDKQKEVKILSRCLAAYAIYYFSQCSPEEAALSVTDGGSDQGIDAIHYSEQARKVFIVQSKWKQDGTGEPDRGDILKFYEGIRKLFNLELDSFNSKVENRKESIISAFNAFDTKFEIILIDTCEKKCLVQDNISLLLEFITSMNENGDENAEPIVSFQRLSQSDIHKSLVQQVNSDSISVELGLSNWGSILVDYNNKNGVSHPCKAYYGSICANEIADWWEKFSDKIFEKNIRKVLGKTDVNDGMEQTLHEEPELFWYYNNGITVIADKIKKTTVGGNSKEIGSFKLENFSVINGAQTVSSIGRFKLKNPNDDNINKANVNIRLIEIGDNDKLVKAITRANNLQNRIEGIDFASQDSEQQRIRTELILEGIEYSIMRSEAFKSTENSFNLQEATIALASVNKNVALAVQVKSAIGKFFENLDRGIYKEIFNASVSGYQVFNAVKFTRKIDSILQDRINNLEKRSGKKYGILVHGNRMLTHLLAKQTGIHNKLSSKDFNIEDIDLSSSLDSIISKTEEFIEKTYPDSFLATLFKNSTKCKQLEAYFNQ